MASLREGAATGAASAIALALPLRSWVFAVEETSAGLANSDCWAGMPIRWPVSWPPLAAPSLWPTAQATSSWPRPPPCSTRASAALPAVTRTAARPQQVLERRARVSTTVGVLVGDGFADALPGDGVAPRRLPPEHGAAPTPDEPPIADGRAPRSRIDATGAALPALAPSVPDALGSGPGSAARASSRAPTAAAFRRPCRARASPPRRS